MNDLKGSVVIHIDECEIFQKSHYFNVMIALKHILLM